MLKRAILGILVLICLIVLPPGLTAAGSADEAVRAPASGPVAGVPAPIDDEEDMGDDPSTPPDLRVVVAAPRFGITGRVGSVLTMARPGRTLNVFEGETVRFVAGVKEAVWFLGSGDVESTLALLGPDPNGAPAPLGRDRVSMAGAAPKIGHGRARVELTFPSAGVFPVDALVRAMATPRQGRGMSRADRVRYEVHVWRAGEMGEVAGLVAGEADGKPLPGMRVVAIDPVARVLTSVAYTNCDGAYLLRRLPPGDYLIAVRGRRGFTGEFYDGAPDPATATPVAVAAGAPTTGIDFLLTHP